jgi:REP element-mobilizing transposase RayT
MAKTPRKHVQLTLESARKPAGHGGWRPNAGRPRKQRRLEPHAAREDFPERFPQHVTLRVQPGLPSMRDEHFVRLIRTQIASSHLPCYRIVHFCVQSNHLHLIVEASDKEALADGVKRTKIRIARRLNRALGRSGLFFDQRYHCRSLTTPLEVRNALVYVLNNTRHHAHERGELLPRDWFDPYSSAPWFDGWDSPLVIDAPWKAAVMNIPRPVELPRTWLLAIGWRRRGLLRVDEVPAFRATETKRRRRAKQRKRDL